VLVIKAFLKHPQILWITLLINHVDWRQSLRNQGFWQNARKKSKTQNPYKSSTYERYLFGSANAENRRRSLRGSTKFVHNSELAL
jgi:hypothetical protein